MSYLQWRTVSSIMTHLIHQYEEKIGDISLRALRQGSEALLDLVTADLAVATRQLERIRAGDLSLSVAVAQEIDASLERAQSRLEAATLAATALRPSPPRTGSA